jgi:hypothetical protein
MPTPCYRMRRVAIRDARLSTCNNTLVTDTPSLQALEFTDIVESGKVFLLHAIKATNLVWLCYTVEAQYSAYSSHR